MAAEGVEARMAEGNVTTDHAKIRKWAEERGGVPATVKGTKSGGEPGLLRLDFEPQGRQRFCSTSAASGNLCAH